MKNGYYGYRRRKKSPSLILILLCILLIGGIGYWAWNSFSGRAEREVSDVKVENESPLPETPEQEIERMVSSGVIGDSQYWIIIDKSDFTLFINKGREVVRSFPIATGLVSGDKEKPGDNRTPEGTFVIEGIENSKHWVYDFGDGKGPVEGAYGPWFIRLETGWEGIGIHGTHDPASIGTRCTAGCIRMNNDDLLEIISKIDEGTTVVIKD